MNRTQRRRLVSKVAAGICLLLALAACWPLFSVLWEVWERGHGVLSWEFLSTDPGVSITPQGLTFVGGIRFAIVGSGIVVGLATLMGAPVGMAAGIFLSEYGRNRFGEVVRSFVDAMAGVPSIVAGLFGYAVVVERWGFSAWAGAVALALLMVPTITRTTEEALRTVPQSLRDASLALGGARWYTTYRVVIPTAWSAVLTGLLLGVARIAGETAPLLLTVLYNQFYSTDPSQPMATLPYIIYNWGKSGYASQVEMAWGAALVLIALVLVVNLTVRLVARSRRRLA